jgi:hypothetical protein
MRVTQPSSSAVHDAVSAEDVPSVQQVAQKSTSADEAVDGIKAWLHDYTSQMHQTQEMHQGVVELIFSTLNLSREHVEELEEFVATELEGYAPRCVRRHVGGTFFSDSDSAMQG